MFLGRLKIGRIGYLPNLHYTPAFGAGLVWCNDAVPDRSLWRCPPPGRFLATAPLRGAPNSIYEQRDASGKLRSRTFYNERGQAFARQDFDHAHGEFQPHEHWISYNNAGFSRDFWNIFIDEGGWPSTKFSFE